MPPPQEIEAITYILGSLDDKIEANRRMNESLEATARAIFKSWFVDFDPVHDKSRGEQPPGMDAATADLFPDSFEGSALGLIPAGWEVASLDEIADYLNGLAMQKYPPKDTDFLPVIKIRELRQGITDENSGQASLDIDPAYIVEDGDILFSWSGSLLVDIWVGGTGGLNQHLFKVTSENFPKWFYYYWTKFHLEEFQRIAAFKATTMGHIQRRHLSDALTIVPNPEVLSQADSLIAPLMDRMIEGRHESRTLAETRDALLPKLVSGEIRVGDV
jgi:type I restriction enzyme S subunit